jgi:hypothetical protein
VTDGGQAAAAGHRKLGLALSLLAGVVLVASAPVVRMVIEGRGEDRASDAALSAGDVAAATVHARRAAAAYVPLASHMGSSYRRLRTIAQQAEMRGDPEAALFAWRAIRSASIASSWLCPTAARERRFADAAIARLSAARHGASLPARRAITEDAARRFAAELEPDNVPARSRVAVVLGGLFALVAGATWWVRSAVSADGKVDMSRAKGAVALCVMGGIGWVVGLLVV